MGLFRKECGYCKTKINKGEEVFRNVKDLVFIDKRQKAFCCSDHADCYEKDIKESLIDIKHLKQVDSYNKGLAREVKFNLKRLMIHLGLEYIEDVDK